MNGRKTPNGYEIKKFVLFENNKGFALGENPSEPEPFATWQFTEENGKRDYYWGHYKKTLLAAEEDFTERVAHYMQMYGVSERTPQKSITEQLHEGTMEANKHSVSHPLPAKETGIDR